MAASHTHKLLVASFFVAVVALLVPLTTAYPQQSGQGVQVQYPGGTVNQQPGQGVQVQYPGGSVNRRPGEGVQVQYPGGFVNRQPGGGVQVAFPGGFVNVPDRIASLFSRRGENRRGGQAQGGFVNFPGGNVNFGR